MFYGTNNSFNRRADIQELPEIEDIFERSKNLPFPVILTISLSYHSSEDFDVILGC